MNKNQVLGLVRHILTAIGGAGLLDAWLTADEVSAGAAAVVTIIGIGWSLIAPEKRKA